MKKDDGATYPAQALADKVKDPVTVVVKVEIDTSGAVQSATVDNPVGHGFDEAAIAAAKTLEYEPAKRNGTPIASKFLHRYVFTPPTSRIVGKVATERGKRDVPLAGATITVTSADGATFKATAGADGAYQVDDLPAGTYKVTVAAEGYVEQAYEHRARR